MSFQTFCLTLLFFSTSAMPKVAPALAAPFAPPPRRGAPDSTAGGGSRPIAASCTLDAQSGQSAIALAPQSFVGLTHQATPNLWFYVPTNEAQMIEISIFDEQLNGLVQFAVGDPEIIGVHAVDLSAYITLSAGVPYYWTAAFVCDPNRRTEDWIVGGWIQYESITTRKQQALLARSPIEQIEQHAGTGYWYDALDVMLSLDPEDFPPATLRSTWNRLVQQTAIALNWTTLNNAPRTFKQ
ncbi:MAG: DUF928 domain-containing protein [Phormidesmis sp.]